MSKCASCSKDTGGAKFCPACGALQPNAAPAPMSGTSTHKSGILGRMSSQPATFKGPVPPGPPPPKSPAGHAAEAAGGGGGGGGGAKDGFGDTQGTSTTVVGQYGAQIGAKVQCSKCGEPTDLKFCPKCGELQKTVAGPGSLGGILSPRAK
jgi:hypothetical protein